VSETGARRRSVVLVSGGLDSCVAATIARRESDWLGLLHADYGQRAAVREREAFERIADALAADERLLVELPHLAAIGGSSLTDHARPIETAEPSTGVPTTYVPFRNANLLAAAVAWAEACRAGYVYLGAVQADRGGYPDCRREFVDAFERAVDLGTAPETHIELVTPLVAKAKADIVRLGVEIGAPLAWTWSCYEGGHRPCERCTSCQGRAAGFADAGISDPAAPSPTEAETL